MATAFLTSFLVRKTGSLLIHVGGALLPSRVPPPQDGITGTVSPGDGVAINTIDLDDYITALIEGLEDGDDDSGGDVALTGSDAAGDDWATGLVLVEKEVSDDAAYRCRTRTRSSGSSVSIARYGRAGPGDWFAAGV